MPRKDLYDKSVYVYVPTAETLQTWKAKAKKGRIPLSKFVVEHVNNSLRMEEGEDGFKPRVKLIQELHSKDEEIQKLTRDLEISHLALERVENELRRYRAAPFLDEGFQGIRKYDKKLIEILRKGEPVDQDRLLHLLRISPKETELVKAVSNQLENLQAYGLVQKTHHGWKWVKT